MDASLSTEMPGFVKYVFAWDILSEEKTKKVPVVKFKRRKNYVRRKGHRQDILKVQITSITASGQEAEE